MTTLKDVAEMAGVSVSTISYVLNGKKKVRPETQKRIDEAIEKLEYYPNLNASSLKTKRFMTVGVIASDLKNLFIVDVLCSIESELNKQGYCMIVCNSENSAEKEKRCLQSLMARNIDGLILIATGENSFARLKKTELPIICIDRDLDKKYISIRTDHIFGGELATKHLISKGYRKILYIGNKHYNFSNEREKGYIKAMQEAGLSDNMQSVYLTSLLMDDAYLIIRKMLDNKREFDAVFACLDYYAIGVLKALNEKGISVPGQVGVIGYDDVLPAALSFPGLTTIAQPKDEIGIAAVNNLLKIINNEKIEKKTIRFKPSLIIRESC